MLRFCSLFVTLALVGCVEPAEYQVGMDLDALEFAIYASVCLSVQLALSHPSCLGMIFRWPPPMHPRCLGGSLARGRLALRQLKHYMYGGQGGRRSADTKPVAV